MAIREVYTGTVTDNNDPEKRGRVCVECPQVVAGDVLEWVEPKFFFVDSDKNAGAFFVPNVGAQIEVEIESGSESQVSGLEPRWCCALYPLGKVPEVFQENYPNRRGWVTAKGHIFYFDDTDDQLIFQYTHPSGTEIYVDNDGKVRIVSDDINLGDETATEHAVLGDALKADLDIYLTAEDTFVTALSAVPGMLAAAGVYKAAITALMNSLAGDLATKVKVS